MKKATISKEPARATVVDPDLIQPDEVQESEINELELAKLVAAHLPYVEGYQTLPEQARGALNNVLEILATIRRWKKGYRWPYTSVEEMLAAPTQPHYLIEAEFRKVAGNRPVLSADSFFRVIFFDRAKLPATSIIQAGWKEFLSLRAAAPNLDLNLETAKTWGSDFREWLTDQKLAALRKRLSRAKNKAVNKTALSMAATGFTPSDEERLNQANRNHSKGLATKKSKKG